MLRVVSTAVASLLLSSTVAAQSSTANLQPAQPSQSCASGAQIIVARASGEAPGEGIIGTVATNIQKQIPNSNIVAVAYPATLGDYVNSEQAGIFGVKSLVTTYTQNCPNGKIILLGYSQGAQVIGDAVIGSDEKAFNVESSARTGLGQQYLDKIAALVMMGDPAFNTANPNHVGNASQNGIFPRQNSDAFSQYGLDSKMVTYCDAGDQYCAGGTGPNALPIHIGYVAEYGDDAVKFAVSKFTGSSGSTGGSTGGGSSASSGSGSGSGSSSAAPTRSSAGGSSAAGGARTSSRPANLAPTSAVATSSSSVNPLSSDRYHPYTGTVTQPFSEVPDLTESSNVAGIHTLERGLGGAVFGAAMFALGML